MNLFAIEDITMQYNALEYINIVATMIALNNFPIKLKSHIHFVFYVQYNTQGKLSNNYYNDEIVYS